MLVAAEKSKMGGKIRLREDQITSIVLGPLLYLPVKDVWLFLKELGRVAGIKEEILLRTEPTSLSIQFWPKHQHVNCEGGRYVEPDALFTFSYSEGTNFHIMLEVKWGGGGLTPKCELVRQWLTRPFPKDDWVHVYLVPVEAKGKKDVSNSIEILQSQCFGLSCCQQSRKFNVPYSHRKKALQWKERIGATSWTHLLQLTEVISANAEGTPFGRWAKGAAAFLAHEGLVPFVGYGWLSDGIYRSLDDVGEMIFFRNEAWFRFITDDAFLDLDETVLAKEWQCWHNV